MSGLPKLKHLLIRQNLRKEIKNILQFIYIQSELNLVTRKKLHKFTSMSIKMQYRAKSKSKTKITISEEGININLAHEDIEFETEIVEYSTILRRKLLNRFKLDLPIRIKVNYTDNKVVRYKPISVKYNGEAIRYVMEVK